MTGRIENFIDGEFRPPVLGEWMDHYAPASGKVDYQLPSSTKEDIELAVEAAKRAFPVWSTQDQKLRSDLLLELADLIERRADELAEVESSDQGMPVRLARRLDIARAIMNFRYFAGHLEHRLEQSSSHGEGLLNYTQRAAVGVAGLISPWNLPLYLLTWKIAPAIACGNTVVAKPSEFTSKTAVMLCELIKQVGIPSGVVNLVLGEGSKAGQALVEHPDVPLISFTGGTATGKAIAKSASASMKKLSLEMGGKNSNILFKSCDLEKAVKYTVRSSFLNQGEICLCGSRVFVHESILDKFTEQMKVKISELIVGDPKDPRSFMGPLVSASHRDKVQGYIDQARSDGAEVIQGQPAGQLPRALQGGYFVPPTMMLGLAPDHVCSREEIFGPVITVHSFSSEDQVLTEANATAYGLSANVWTQDLSQAHRVAQKLDVATVWVNTWLSRDLRMPFGGVRGSGLGREGGDYSVDFFTEVKTVCVQY